MLRLWNFYSGDYIKQESPQCSICNNDAIGDFYDRDCQQIRLCRDCYNALTKRKGFDMVHKDWIQNAVNNAPEKVDRDMTIDEFVEKYSFLSKERIVSMEYKCKRCNKIEKDVKKEVYELRNGLCGDCHYIKSEIQDMISRLYFIGSKNEINDEDFKYIASAKRQLEILMEKYICEV